MSSILSRVTKRNIPPVKQVKLKLVHIDFWSAIRVGFVVSLGLGIATIIGFIFVWLALSQTGVFSSLNNLINGTAGTANGSVDVGQELNLPRVLSFATSLAIFGVVVGTLLSGVTAAVFNVIGRITGGLAVGFTNN